MEHVTTPLPRFRNFEGFFAEAARLRDAKVTRIVIGIAGRRNDRSVPIESLTGGKRTFLRASVFLVRRALGSLKTTRRSRSRLPRTRESHR